MSEEVKGSPYDFYDERFTLYYCGVWVRKFLGLQFTA